MLLILFCTHNSLNKSSIINQAIRIRFHSQITEFILTKQVQISFLLPQRSLSHCHAN